ncbi:MAG: hypothetical protein SPL15_00555 [Lachnospiraceae bacterium]|nr:hypothetical protein [Lachnospiraceae bacterium]MDY5741478.1 hypothetical protein [Lachnospiraceae bacterium]
MKKISKQLAVMAIIVGIIASTVPSYAMEYSSNNTGNFLISSESHTNGEGIEVNFKEFSFITGDYKEDDVYTMNHVSSAGEIVKIVDKDTGSILETMTVKKAEFTNHRSAVYPYTFTRTKHFGITDVYIDIAVELYNRGSFRQINSIQYHYVGVSSRISPMALVDKSSSVWSPGNKFPTIEVNYGYSGTLETTLDIGVNGSVNAGLEAKLLNAGFSVGGSGGGKVYYRRPVLSNGTIRLY